MSNRMLINATQSEELRVAIVKGQRLENLDIEQAVSKQKKANIYKGVVSRVEPSLEAAFIDYGADRHGFLPSKEVARDYYAEGSDELRRPSIKDLLKPGQEILVQVDKEERGTKGAALTTYISLAGCYLVLMPNNPRAGGISRRIEGGERAELRDVLKELSVPEGMGLIVRTAGLGRSLEELEWDLSVLLSQWEAIQRVVDERKGPFLVYQESDVIVRAIRDYLRPDISEILVDTEEAFERAKSYIAGVRPDFLSRIKLYQDPLPLFNRYQIESQIESAFQREVVLENRASIVIDPTEALTSIDINSSKATEGADIEETAFKTNEAAAREIARQLRIRDTGGLIVIDFIDMNSPRHQRGIENVLREEMRHDRARVQIGRISRFGLLEMSRQRVRPSLDDATQLPCTRCEGQGTIRTIPSLALSILRVIEEEAMKQNTGQVRAQVPVKVATFLLNEKRRVVHEIEERHGCHVLILPNKDLQTPKYTVERVREDNVDSNAGNSYDQVEKLDRSDELVGLAKSTVVSEQPALRSVTPTAPILPRTGTRSTESGIISRLWSAVFGVENKIKDKTDNRSRSDSSESDDEQGGNRSRSRYQNGNGNRNRNNNNRRNNNRNRRRQNDDRPSDKVAANQNDEAAIQNEDDDNIGNNHRRRGPQQNRSNNNNNNRRRNNNRGNGNNNNTGTNNRSRGGSRQNGNEQRAAVDTRDEDSLSLALPSPEEQLSAKERAFSTDPDTATVIDQPDNAMNNNGAESGNNRRNNPNQRRRRRGQYGNRRKSADGSSEANSNTAASGNTDSNYRPDNQSVSKIEVANPSEKTQDATPPTSAPMFKKESKPAASTRTDTAPKAVSSEQPKPKKEAEKKVEKSAPAKRSASRMPPPVSPLASPQGNLQQVVSKKKPESSETTSSGSTGSSSAEG
ncbi:MAG: ribonuclease E/G [Legionellales bacterium]|nr:ribonuclease E/G [Legionellales bacterium]